MTEATYPTSAEDAAWASFPTTMSAKQLEEFCLDIERLFRINPFLEFQRWQKLDNNRYRVKGRNISQEPAFDFDFDLKVEKTAQGLIVRYSHGLKFSTQFNIESTDSGAKLTIIDDYSPASKRQREQSLNEVDKSLVMWATDLQNYIFQWQRWSWLAPWRWYMRRIWQPMNPHARRITYMLLWISFAEIAFIALGFCIYWLEF